MEEEWKQNEDIFQTPSPRYSTPYLPSLRTSQTLVENCILWWELDCAKISRQGRIKHDSSGLIISRLNVPAAMSSSAFEPALFFFARPYINRKWVLPFFRACLPRIDKRQATTTCLPYYQLFGLSCLPIGPMRPGIVSAPFFIVFWDVADFRSHCPELSEKSNL